jgi:chemotaxis protein MotB
VAKKQLEEDEGPSDAWLASYADAMTLLLAFFIMMYAFALVDLAKFQDLKVGVQAAFGLPEPVTDNTDSILSDGEGIAPEVGFNPVEQSSDKEAETTAIRSALANAGTVTPENAEDLKTLLENEFERVGASDYVEVGIDERGVFIRFDGRVLFDSGSADLDSAGLTLLTTSASVLTVIDNTLEVEGHTDNRPTGTDWPSNWELSAARASTVVRWLIDAGGVPDPQLVAVGRADTRPRADNSTAAGRQENRRVEIVVRVPGMVESGVDLIGSDPVGVDDVFGDVTEDETPTSGSAVEEAPAEEAPADGDPVGASDAVDPDLPTDEPEPTG